MKLAFPTADEAFRSYAVMDRVVSQALHEDRAAFRRVLRRMAAEQASVIRAPIRTGQLR